MWYKHGSKLHLFERFAPLMSSVPLRTLWSFEVRITSHVRGFSLRMSLENCEMATVWKFHKVKEPAKNWLLQEISDLCFFEVLMLNDFEIFLGPSRNPQLWLPAVWFPLEAIQLGGWPVDLSQDFLRYATSPRNVVCAVASASKLG